MTKKASSCGRGDRLSLLLRGLPRSVLTPRKCLLMCHSGLPGPPEPARLRSPALVCAAKKKGRVCPESYVAFGDSHSSVPESGHSASQALGVGAPGVSLCPARGTARFPGTPQGSFGCREAIFPLMQSQWLLQQDPVEGRGQEPIAWQGVPKRDCPRLPTCEIPNLREISNRDFQRAHLNLFTPVLVLRTCLMCSLSHSKGSSGYLPCSTFWVCGPDRAQSPV